MVVVCPVCCDYVHVFAGYIVRHGTKGASVFNLCSGSGMSYVEDCCGL